LAKPFDTECPGCLRRDGKKESGENGISLSEHNDLGRSCAFVLVISIAKLAGELCAFVHLRDSEWTNMKRTAMLMAHDLKAANHCTFCLRSDRRDFIADLCGGRNAIRRSRYSDRLSARRTSRTIPVFYGSYST
jgi:hypothetical protein